MKLCVSFLPPPPPAPPSRVHCLHRHIPSKRGLETDQEGFRLSLFSGLKIATLPGSAILADQRTLALTTTDPEGAEVQAPSPSHGLENSQDEAVAIRSTECYLNGLER